MNKKSFWASWLLLGPVLVTSCADLRDSDECYRWARLVCEKACASSDKNACIAFNKADCHTNIKSTADNESWFTDCSDKLASLGDCAGSAKVAETCGPEPTTKCSYDDECPSNLCLSGLCVRGGPTSTTGSCSSSADCAGSKYCASDNQCYESCNSVSDCNSGESCTYDSTPARNLCFPSKSSPQPGSKGGIGDSCQFSSDCDSTYDLTCRDDRCTKPCTSTSNCTSARSDAVCAGSSNNYYCTVPCTSSATCAGSQTCQSLSLASGGNRQVCSPDSSTPITLSGDIGAPCSTSSDCNGSLSCQLGLCTETCVSNSDCSGDTYTGQSPVCIVVAPGSRYCLAGCSAGGSDCASDQTCSQLPTSSGGSSYVCRPTNLSGTTTGKGTVGDTCSSSSDCDATQGLMCSGQMCTKPCQQSFDCPAASNGEGSRCVSPLCTRTCINSGCPGSWSCGFDPNSQQNVCMIPR